MKSKVPRLRAALKDLIKRYEAGERTLASGLCNELQWHYDLPDAYSYSLIDQYQAAASVNAQASRLGDYGFFTEARYNFCKQLLADVEAGKKDKFWASW